MIKIGITGGIGSGKSIVATLLSCYGVPLFIADIESKKLVNHSPTIKEQLISLFGTSIYTPQGVDRAQLAGYIFSDATLLNQVNKIIHPEVNNAFMQWAEVQHTPVVAMESAILFESGFNHFVDVTLTVQASEALRIQRAALRDNCHVDIIKQRMQHQSTDDAKAILSDYTLSNDNASSLIRQIDQIMRLLK
jgi:dephospho-CoA kinase